MAYVEPMICGPCPPQGLGKRRQVGCDSSNCIGACGPSRSPKKRKTCNFAQGCDKQAKAGGFCIAHGGAVSKKSRCKFPQGCEKQGKTGGFCIAHGGTFIKCKHVDGCQKKAQAGGFCKSHGGLRLRTICRHPDGCNKQSKVGRYCKAHSKLVSAVDVLLNVDSSVSATASGSVLNQSSGVASTVKPNSLTSSLGPWIQEPDSDTSDDDEAISRKGKHLEGEQKTLQHLKQQLQQQGSSEGDDDDEDEEEEEEEELQQE